MAATRPTPLVIGNWKMNGDGQSLALADEIAAAALEVRGRVRAGIAPPATLLSRLAERLSGQPVKIGGQDCHAARSGAHTGDVAAAMLAEAGASFVILGHSERRADHGEDSALVSAKASAALDAGLTAVICVGESLDERDAGRAEDVVTRQVAESLPPARATSLVVAYEPVWAIGTGRTASPADVGAMHAAIRMTLGRLLSDAGERTPILYGGSVKPSNAAELAAVPDVDGALVGGASLVAADFAAILRAFADR